MRLLDGDGIELVKYIQKKYEHIPVAVITAYGNMELAVTALKAGAFDFVSKPVNIQLLKNLVNAAKQQIDIDSPTLAQPQSQLLGNSDAITNIKKLAMKVAKSQAPVMIIGDSETGKELYTNEDALGNVWAVDSISLVDSADEILNKLKDCGTTITLAS